MPTFLSIESHQGTIISYVIVIWRSHWDFQLTVTAKKCFDFHRFNKFKRSTLTSSRGVRLISSSSPTCSTRHVECEPGKNPAHGAVNLWDYNAPNWGSEGKVEIFNIKWIGCSMNPAYMWWTKMALPALVFWDIYFNILEFTKAHNKIRWFARVRRHTGIENF